MQFLSALALLVRLQEGKHVGGLEEPSAAVSSDDPNISYTKLPKRRE
jgi:hypothetical protein